MGEYSPDGGMIRRAQVGKMKFGTSVLVGFDRILPSRACFASTVGAACAVGGYLLARYAIGPNGASVVRRRPPNRDEGRGRAVVPRRTGSGVFEGRERPGSACRARPVAR